MSSPVQHFWSLSIQGQFFFVWPLLVALVALAARGERRPGARAPDRRDPRRVRRLADVLGGADRDEPAAGLLPLADPLVGVRARRPARADDRQRSGCRGGRGSTSAGSGSPGCWRAAPCCAWALSSPGSPRCGPPGVRCWCCSPAPPVRAWRRGPAAHVPAAALRRRPELPAVPVALARAGVLPGAHRPRPARLRSGCGGRRAVGGARRADPPPRREAGAARCPAAGTEWPSRAWPRSSSPRGCGRSRRCKRAQGDGRGRRHPLPRRARPGGG